MFGVSTSLNSIIYLLNSKQAEVFLKNDALMDIAYTVYVYQKKERKKNLRMTQRKTDEMSICIDGQRCGKK